MSQYKEITCHHLNKRFGETEIHGTYSGPVSKNDIVASFGNGALGHKFLYFGAGTFILLKYESIDEMMDNEA